MPSFLREHSLSLVLFVGGVVLLAVAFGIDDQRWWDVTSMCGGGMLLAAFFVVTKKFCVERGKHPSPESK